MYKFLFKNARVNTAVHVAAFKSRFRNGRQCRRINDSLKRYRIDVH